MGPDNKGLAKLDAVDRQSAAFCWLLARVVVAVGHNRGTQCVGFWLQGHD